MPHRHSSSSRGRTPSPPPRGPRHARALVLALALAGCQRNEPAIELAPHPRVPLPPEAAQTARSSSASPAQEAPPLSSDAASAAAWSELIDRLSEPDAPFFSDNFISNETSYLDVAASLAERSAKGGAYIGVGPEQNFTYIAETKPRVAFLVDLRRQNMLLHLLYKAIFDVASSQSEFLALLTGRPYDAAAAPPASASIDDVIAHVERLTPSEQEFTSIHDKLVSRIEATYRVALNANDKVAIEKAHRAFFSKQLELRFELKKANGRAYPSLRELLTARDPKGKELGFLADEASFRFVQTLEREHRIVPVVGDVAGDRAMPGIAAYLDKAGLKISAFYISNVEQYLFEPGVWSKWSRNVGALPSDERSLFIRAYLDQGKPHPQQRKGQRTATVLQRIADFQTHNAKSAYTSFWAVATDDVLHP